MTVAGDQAVRGNWFDRRFTDNRLWMLICMVFLLGGAMWIFSGLGLLITKTPIARRRAKIVFTVSCVYLALLGTLIIVLVKYSNP
jgi:heme O synthase-like polyprenyltransferase